MALFDCCCGEGDGAVEGTAVEVHIELIAAADVVEGVADDAE